MEAQEKAASGGKEKQAGSAYTKWEVSCAHGSGCWVGSLMWPHMCLIGNSEGKNAGLGVADLGSNLALPHYSTCVVLASYLTFLINKECRLPTCARVMERSHVTGLLEGPGSSPLPQDHYQCRDLCVTEEPLDFPRASSTRKSPGGPSSSQLLFLKCRNPVLLTWPVWLAGDLRTPTKALSQRWAPGSWTSTQNLAPVKVWGFQPPEAGNPNPLPLFGAKCRSCRCSREVGKAFLKLWLVTQP